MAHRIRFGAEATEIARKLAVGIAEQAADRDRERRPPADELAALSDSGLLGITVPARHGGAEVSVAVLTEVFRTLAAADASLAQIPQSHFVFLDALRRQGTREQQALYFARALDGARFANAQTERGGRTVTDDATALRRSGRGRYVLDGVKYYSTGALFADVLVVRAVLPDEPPLPDGSPPKALAYIDRASPGVAVEDDWDGMGQRTTASGTVRLERVRVRASEVIPYNALFEGPTTYGARAQVLHAALDAGIARGALAAAVTAAGRARPWFESGADTAAGDPLLVQRAGELEIAVRGAEALLREAAETIDAAERVPSADATARASIATAAAKVATGRAALEASSALFELGGTRSAAADLNLSRHWRDARTHTLHDPERWKVQHIGRWLLQGTPPPRHGQL
ncbi:SfnB family sulfur acquisition oxidoreductase [Actinomadura graeca]|uniref:SfnB family sulfur acquisition oxidoreductase n=1 Tax=Actinomadura graeca TaxID=2750812 RepID=A0ABX8QW47_9ACTN|nr:SfnB family sulfur acquisition oxidoreductase [Actinomadura graeca]QXJ22209.1 SfnB family sulfur acquisition oxidoreductase [Actinomadura graeca]